MKKLLTVYLLLLATQSLAVDDRFLDAVAMIESSRNPDAIGDGGKARGEFQLHKPAWEQVSAARKAAGKPVYSWDNAHNRSIAREYARDYLSWIEKSLTKHLGRAPKPWEMYASYNRGVNGFLETKGIFNNLPPHTRRACSRLSSLLTQDSTSKR